jgi:hypothetical protein
MAAMSSRPFTADGIKSATEVNRSVQQEDAPVRRIAEMELESLRSIMIIAAELLSIQLSDALSYDIVGNTEFGQITSDPQDAQNLLNAFVSGAIDRTTYLEGIVKSIESLKGIDPADIADRLGGGDGFT